MAANETTKGLFILEMQPLTSLSNCGSLFRGFVYVKEYVNSTELASHNARDPAPR